MGLKYLGIRWKQEFQRKDLCASGPRQEEGEQKKKLEEEVDLGMGAFLVAQTVKNLLTM